MQYADGRDQREHAKSPPGDKTNIRRSSLAPRQGSFESDGFKRNSLIFAIILMSIQIGITFVYGFLIEVPIAQLNMSSAFVMVLLGILIIGGNFQDRQGSVCCLVIL